MFFKARAGINLKKNAFERRAREDDAEAAEKKYKIK
jgi:hypothetical protein